METTRSNSSNKSSNASKDPGIYTCPTCNALFTCLKFYQQHVSQHADANGTKLFCCNRCRYSTDSAFQYNWHQMSHKNTPAHSCSVCLDKSKVDSYHSSNNHLNGSDSVATNKNSRKAQQNGNSNKKIKYSNSKVKQPVQPYVRQEESDEEDEDEESEEGESETEESQENEDEEDNENEEDDESEEESGDDDEEEEIEEEVDQSQLQSNVNYERPVAMANNNQEQEIDDDEEVSDEDDDEESEIESEEDNGENNELPDEFLVSQRLNSSSAYQYDSIQNAINNNGSTVANNNLIDQGSALSKQSNSVGDIPELLTDNDGIICNKGKGKGNRKSRTINQMGGQVDDELSQLRRKFHCSHCGKSFKTKSHLQRHILTHTGEKPYHCNRCGAKFNQSSSLRNHIIALHTKEYPHFCNHCNKGFLMPALLQKHLQTSHRDQDA